MKTEKLGQEPAFPNDPQNINFNGSGIILDASNGMTKRQLLAGMAMQGIISNNALRIDMIMDSKNMKTKHQDYIAEYALELADALLKQEAL